MDVAMGYLGNRQHTICNLQMEHHEM